MESHTEHSYIHLHKFIETVLFCDLYPICIQILSNSVEMQALNGSIDRKSAFTVKLINVSCTPQIWNCRAMLLQ